MRALLVLVCIVCLAVARPQLGYNYEPPNIQSIGLQQQQLILAPLESAQEQLQSVQPLPAIIAPFEQISFNFGQSLPSPLPTTPTSQSKTYDQGQFTSNEHVLNQFTTQQVPFDHSVGNNNINQASSINAATYTDHLHGNNADHANAQQSADQQQFTSHFTQGTFDNRAGLDFANIQQSQLQQFQSVESQQFNALNAQSNTGFDFVSTQQQNVQHSAEQSPSEKTSQDKAGTLDSFNFDSAFGSNPEDNASPAPKVQGTDLQNSILITSTPTQQSQNVLPIEQIQPEIQSQDQPKTIHKHIYVHVPPPEFEEPAHLPTPLVVENRKRYNIVFIKAPSVRQPSIARQLQAQTQTEDKTIIYVLVKKNDQPTQIIPHTLTEVKPDKPEVYFIKYKTQKGTVEAAQPTLTTTFAEQANADEHSKISQFKEASDAAELSAFEKQTNAVPSFALEGDNALEQTHTKPLNGDVSTSIDLREPSKQYLPIH